MSVPCTSESETAVKPIFPTRSVTTPGVLVTAESEENEYKSLLELATAHARGSGSGSVTADTICKKIGSDVWTKEFNAFLNSRAGGTIHFGIGDDCKVEEGVCLTEKDQDVIRLRIVQVFNQFFPTTLSQYFEVCFIKLDNDHYRFDVDIKHASRIRYMSLEKTVAYTRCGASCCRLKAEELEHRIQEENFTQTTDATINAFIEAQVIMRIRDARMAFPTVLSSSYEREALKLLGNYSEMCDIYQYSVHVAREFLRLLTSVIGRCDVRAGMPESVAVNIADQAYSLQIMYGNGGTPGGDLSDEQFDDRDYNVLSEIYFQIAYDGILYRRSRSLFMLGAIPLVSLVSKIENARKRYDQLEPAVLHSDIDKVEQKKCVNYLKLLQCWEEQKRCGRSDDCAKTEDEIFELGFRYHI